MTYHFATVRRCKSGVGFPYGRKVRVTSGQYGGARRRAARSEVEYTGGGANQENLP